MLEALPTDAGDPGAPLRYLALGDSYTIGEGVDPSQCWPGQLAQALRADGVAIDAPRTIAQTGWTTDELEAALDAAALQPEYDLVSLLIGVNNQYRERPLEEYRQQFSALLLHALALAQGRHAHVLVLSIPDWGVTPFARDDARGAQRIGEAVDAFNTVAREVCQQHCVVFVDITPVSRAYGAEPTMLVADGLHPSAPMYARWMQLALPHVHAMQVTS